VEEQAVTDRQNAAFWSELCGSSFARHLGLTGAEPDALDRFDAAYFSLYPYLKGYADRHAIRGRDVLEIGLGYGTFGQYLVERGCTYRGLDVASAPVEMLRRRLAQLGRAEEYSAVVGSALQIPFADASFDYVFSIGCLHHTGDLPRAVGEVFRVLRPGGTAVLMLYNGHSLRQLWTVNRMRLSSLGARGDARRAVRALYDSNSSGEAAPHTDFVSRRDVRRLLVDFENVEIRAENTSGLTFRRRTLLTRDRLLATPLPRWLGLDLYITASKPGAAKVQSPINHPTNKAGS
jgi:SAM-dependent methyltransferase